MSGFEDIGNLAIPGQVALFLALGAHEDEAPAVMDHLRGQLPASTVAGVIAQVKAAIEAVRS